MADADKLSALQPLFRHVMEPIVSMLIRSGITHRAFSQMSKSVFVKVAAREYGVGGRETNDTRIAMLTGIDRREVRRLKLDTHEDDDAQQTSLQNQNRVTRLLSGWHQDSEFLDNDGKPAVIPAKGEHPSFESLASRYGGDVTVSALLSEMIRSAVVEQNSDGSLRALKRYYIPAREDFESLARAGSVIHDFSNLLVHNLYVAEKKKNIPLRFERTALNDRIDPAHLEEFHQYLNSEGQNFLEKVDQWLSEHEVADGSEAHGITLGTGAYFIAQDSRQDWHNSPKDKTIAKSDTEQRDD